MKADVRVYDPAMCCSTGVCGTSVDPRLARFAADLDWLKGQGVSVRRFNLSQEPGAFVAEARAKVALETLGETSLPLVIVNGDVRSSGVYPSREDLAAWTGLRHEGEPATRAASACCSPSGDASGSKCC